MTDYRIGRKVQLHPPTDAWMKGDRYGVIVSISRRVRSFIDPKDPRNGQVFRVKMNRSGRTLRLAEGYILKVF